MQQPAIHDSCRSGVRDNWRAYEVSPVGFLIHQDTVAIESRRKDGMNASDTPAATITTGRGRGAYLPIAKIEHREKSGAVGRAIRQARLPRSQELKANILAALMGSGYAALNWVGCEVRGDQVILQGSVPSYHLKQLAQVFAQRVDGVSRIQNCLEVSRRRPA